MIRNRAAVTGAVFFTAFLLSSYTGSLTAFIAAFCFGASAAVMCFIKRMTAAFVFTAAFAAFLIYGIYSVIYIEPVSRLFGNTYDISADIISADRSDSDTLYVTARCTADGIPLNISFYSPDTGLEPGDTADITVKFSEPYLSASYNSDYSYSHGIFVRSYVNSAYVTRKGSGIPSLIPRYSTYLREKVREYLTGDACGLMLAMCFGDRSVLSAEMSDAVMRSGLSHMAAVSGMHISLIVVTIVSFAGSFSKRSGHILRFVTACVLCAVFILFFDAKPSVCRSAIMLILHYGSSLFRRGNATLNALGAAVLLILLAEPCACRDPGLMLSACGTFGAGVMAPRCCERLNAMTGKLPRTAESAVVCVCASVCTVPLSALFFGGISLVSVFSTLLFFPFFTAAMVLALMTAATGGITAGILLPAAGLVLKAGAVVIRFFAGIPYSYISADETVMTVFIAATAVFAGIAVPLSLKVSRGSRFRAAAAVICVCALASSLTARKAMRSDITEITVYSDGSDFLVTVADEAGISAFASDINKRLSSQAYSALAAHGRQKFSLLCLITEKKHSAVYSEAFASINALEKRLPDNSESAYDISGKYTAEVYEDAVCLDINGVSVVLCDISAAPIYGGNDIAVYSGYKRSAEYDINGITVLCDKRYPEPSGAVNAYFDKTVLLIDRSGRVSATPSASLCPAAANAPHRIPAANAPLRIPAANAPHRIP